MTDSVLQDRLGYRFVQPQLLQRALTHRSYSQAHNERLEFLGDSVLNCAVAQYLFEQYPAMPEGELSRLRSNLVNQQTLHSIACKMDLGRLLQLGEGELKSGGRQRPSILADGLEALIGAIFLDGGYVAAQEVVRHLYVPFLLAGDVHNLGKDPKTQLQEYLQARKLKLPEYSVVATAGEAHAQTFEVECTISQLSLVTRGTGTSRRAAEQVAAQAAILELGKKHGET